MVLLGLLILLVSCMLGVAVLLRTASHARDSWMAVSGTQCSLAESSAVDETDLTLPSATGPPGPLAVWRLSVSFIVAMCQIVYRFRLLRPCCLSGR